MSAIKQFCILTGIVAVLMLSGCVAEKPRHVSELANRPPEHKTLESMENLYNGGMVCGADDWLFFVDEAKKAICRVKQNGKELAVLKNYHTDNIERLQVSGSWLYYFEYNDVEWDDYIRRIDLNGTEDEVLEDLNLTEFWAVDQESIYTIRGGSYFVRSDFCERGPHAASTNLRVSSFDEEAFLCDGSLYYTDRESLANLTKQVYRIDLPNPDNPLRICFIHGDASNIIVNGGYVYYLHDHNLFRIPADQAADPRQAKSIGHGNTAILLRDETVLLADDDTLTRVTPDKGVTEDILTYPKGSLEGRGPYAVDGQVYVLFGDDDIDSVCAEHCTLENIAGPLYRIILADK